MDSQARHRLLSTVDQLLLERGELDPLEYLLAIGGVDYADYREWRHRRRPVLQSALRFPVEEVTAALAHAQAYAIEQHLSVEVCPPTAWDQDQGPLSVGPSRTLAELCSHRLVRARNRLQGDLFQDSAKTIALDAVNRALAEHRFDAGRSALERLSELPNTHVLVNDYLRLIVAAERCSTEPAERLRELEEDVAPFGSQHSRRPSAGLSGAAVGGAGRALGKSPVHAQLAEFACQLRARPGSCLESRGISHRSGA